MPAFPWERHALTHFQGLNALRPFTPDETKLYRCLLDLEAHGQPAEFSTRRRAEGQLELTTETLIAASEGLQRRGLLYYVTIGKKPGSWCGWSLNRIAPYHEAIIPAEVLEQKISWPARVLLGEVLGLQATWGLVFAEDSYFADRFYLSVRSVRAALRELTVAGLLRQDTRRSRIPERLLFPFPAPCPANQ